MAGLNLEVSTNEFEKVCRVLGDINQVCRIFCSVSELQSVSRCRVLGSLGKTLCMKSDFPCPSILHRSEFELAVHCVGEANH
jgi:hypothetical protein